MINKKKIYQQIKLRKLKSQLNEDSLKILEGTEFVVLFKDNTYKNVYFKEDLIRIIEQDHIKPIHYIFDYTDRIILDRDILINIEGVVK